MKVSSGELEKKAEEALRSSLSRVPFLKIENFRRQTSKEAVRPDFLIKIALPEGAKYLVKGQLKSKWILLTIVTVRI